MKRELLTDDELSAQLKTLSGWAASGNAIVRRFEFENFANALRFVNAVGTIAENADHHPDITFGWGYCELKLTTHDRGGVTDFDVAVALRIDALDAVD